MIPNRTRRLARLTAVGLAAGALAAPAASARPAPLEPAPPDGGTTAVAIEPEPAPAPGEAAVVRSADEGFDWGSAAIGAGAAGALLVLSVGGLGGAFRHRDRMRVAR